MYDDLREKALKDAKAKIKSSVNNDNLVILTVNAIEDLEKHANGLVSRVRDWFDLVNPELSRELSNEKLVKVILKREKLVSEMGAVLSDEDLNALYRFADSVNDLFDTKDYLQDYLKKKLQVYTPNLEILLGSMLTAKILREIKSLKRLASVQKSTVQLLGAEKAFFKHLVKGSKSPKHGFIVNHPFVQKSKDKGKAARLLSDKIVFCARLDYFKGELLAHKFLEELESKKL